MNILQDSFRLGAVLIVGGLCCCVLPAFPVFAATEKVEVVKTRPDDTDPLYEIITTKEGHVFRLPKGTPIEKRDGMIMPMAPEEYLLQKVDSMSKEIKALSDRVERIEKIAEEKKDKLG